MSFKAALLIQILLTSLIVTAASAQTVAQLPSPAAAGTAEPFLSRTKDGLLLSWLEPLPGTKRMALRFARLAKGVWSPPQTVLERDDLFVNWADFPSIVADVKGVLFAHWLQMSATGTYTYDVRMSTSSDGGRTWGKPFLLNRDGRKVEHGFVTLTPLPGGGVGATWLDGRNMPEGKEEGEMSVRYARVDASGNVTSDVEIDGRTCECCTTAMTIAGGRPIIAYRDRSQEEVRDIALVRQTTRGWSAPRPLHTDGWKIAGCPVNGPQLASLGRRVVAAWFTAAGDRGRVYAAFSEDAGATFGEPVAVDGGKPIGRVDVVMLDADSAVVSWSEQTPAGAELRARRIRRNLQAGPSIKVADSSGARAAGFPRMETIGRDVYMTWTEQDGKSKRVRLSRIRF